MLLQLWLLEIIIVAKVLSSSNYYFYYHFESLRVFTYQSKLMVFHWSLNETQVSRTLLGILIELSNAVVWFVFIHPLISKCTSSFINPFVTIPRAEIKSGITVNFMLQSLFFFNSLARWMYLSFFSLSFNFTFWSAGNAKSTICSFSFFHNYKFWSSAQV